MKLGCLIIGFVFITGCLYGQKMIIKASGPINDFIASEKTITAATSLGTIEVYNIATKKLINKIRFPKITDFSGDKIDAEVFKIIRINSDLYAIVHGLDGFNDIYKVRGSKITKILNGKTLKSVAIDIATTNDSNIIIGLLSNEILKYNPTTKVIMYRNQISYYAFSSMTISKDGKYLYTSDESGELHKISTKTGTLLKTYKGQNVDNVLTVAYASGVIVCGGKDRRFTVYKTKNNTAYYINTNNFITSVGISPSGEKAVWYDDATNNLILFNISNKTKIKTLNGHNSMVSKIEFYSENRIISCGIDKQIIIWKI